MNWWFVLFLEFVVSQLLPQIPSHDVVVDSLLVGVMALIDDNEGKVLTER